MKKILILVFIIICGVMSFQGKILQQFSGKGIINLELAKKDTGVEIIALWSDTLYGDQTLLNLAQKNTHFDFLFIFVYVVLIMTLSNAQMQREKASWLNELLRLNLFLAFLIGSLDVIENIRLLHSFHHPRDIAEFWRTDFIAWPKFVIAGWVILVYVFSIIKGYFNK
ncbi:MULTISPECIES: hypothetical protein [unclassified Pedobacter]|uniref:hypothetical protein n=1 Tax=unclassified Pedobacter TaxID=2628915 RepID=UPI00141FF968|nr:MULTISPECIES: hypothetical protein [unclassified Pedobacter]NII82385.1 putative membrane protein [Pedobacter sp. SG908]NMN36411.1 putative membrane protein [Pedobacter sp. SG918]